LYLRVRQVNEHHGLLSVGLGVIGGGLAHDDAHLASRVPSTGDVPFRSIDDISPSGLLLNGALDVGRVAGSHCRLGHSET
jgi:hypothetical protein